MAGDDHDPVDSRERSAARQTALEDLYLLIWDLEKWERTVQPAIDRLGQGTVSTHSIT